ncbi:MAG TPA: ATP-binding protein, partial [Polyangiales bacterium]|nr:ATP-binding protein [Polyangiales bacterium]
QHLAIDADSNPDGATLLARWRERVLQGLLAISIAAVIPALLIDAWQAAHAPSTQSSSAVGLGLTGLACMIGLHRWRGRSTIRAGLLIGVCFALTLVGIVREGFAPAEFVVLCLLATVCVLLISTGAAYLMLGASALAMAIAAIRFHGRVDVPIASNFLDPTNPLNWLRVALYTLFASGTAAAATSYLLGKLRATLDTRAALIDRLSREIAQREHALVELERTQARLLHAQKLEAIGQLAAGIAHDFNNTLSVVTLEAELLRRRNQPDSVARGAEALLGAAAGGSQLTRQLLLFSRPDRIERTVIDATIAFDECVQALKRLLPSELTFEVDITAGPLPVYLHPSELQQIVLNLGINARDAMSSGGHLRLTLERRLLTDDEATALGIAPGTYAISTCHDSGIGMSSATLARVFEPFFTTKAPGRGTGLGLTNVWNIAERAGGTVHVESALGEGTHVSVYLPIASQPMAAATIMVGIDAADGGGQETLLVVEDDIRIRALLVSLLTDAGYSVLDAANVDAALALERDHAGPIDLLCTDVVMPGRPARELLSELRARRPHAGILICSGYSEDEQIARGIRSGEWKHLGKPFTRGALLTAVRRTLDEA